MRDLKNIKYWLFDLDNTLYDGATNVFDQVDKKMTAFISENLKYHQKKQEKFKKIIFKNIIQL